MTCRGPARVAVLLFLLLFPFAAQAAERGFFTGKRAEVIVLLAEANRPNLSRDDALAAVLRAREAGQGLDDPYLDYFIDQALAEIYRELGDADAAAARFTAAAERFAGAMKKDGPAQAMYTMHLIGYDMNLPVASLFGKDRIGGLQEYEADIEEALAALEVQLEDPDLEPRERAMLEDMARTLRRSAADLAEGLIQGDGRKLRRARGDVARLMDDLIRRAPAELSGEDKVVVTATRAMTLGMVDMAIAAAERNRRAFEKAARATAAGMNQLLALDSVEVQVP